jgi:hypothetical protein
MQPLLLVRKASRKDALAKLWERIDCFVGTVVCKLILTINKEQMHHHDIIFRMEGKKIRRRVCVDSVHMLLTR